MYCPATGWHVVDFDVCQILDWLAGAKVYGQTLSRKLNDVGVINQVVHSRLEFEKGKRSVDVVGPVNSCHEMDRVRD